MIDRKIKFINKDKSTFFSNLREQVDLYFEEKGFSKFGGRKIILKSVLMLSIYFIPFLLIITNQFSPWQMLGLTILMGVGVAGVGMGVMHDANHGSFSSKSWVNELFGGTLYLLGGSVYTWKVKHNTLHHTYTNINEMDDDITGKFLLRLSGQQPLKKIHKYQHVYAFFLYGLMTFAFIFKDFSLIFKYSKVSKQPASREMGKLILSKVIYFLFILVLPLVLVDITWWQWLIGFVVLHFTTGLILSVIFQLAHIVEDVAQPEPNAQGAIENAWAIHQLQTTANFAKNNRPLSWFIGGLNFQIEHHLFPNISHIHYKEISQIVKRTAESYNLPYIVKPTFNDAFFSHVRMLRKMGVGENV